MRFDLHIHTEISACSNLPVSDLLAVARQRGLDGICITDHDTTEVRKHIREGIQPDGLCVIVGMEYETPDGDFLIFGPTEEIEIGLSAPQMLDKLHRRGGVAIAAHPQRNWRPTQEYVVRDGHCTIIETLNGRNGDLENLRSLFWCDKYRVKATGGSDAHTVGEIGKIVTEFQRPIKSRQELIQALKNGEYSPEWNFLWPTSMNQNTDQNFYTALNY